MSLFPDPPPPRVPPPEDPSPSKGLPSITEIRKSAKRDLLLLVPEAIKALRKAIDYGDPDDALAVKAACAVLDRTGFGTHSTVTLDDAAANLTNLTTDQLLVRAQKVQAALEARKQQPTSTSDGSTSDSDSPEAHVADQKRILPFQPTSKSDGPDEKQSVH